MGADRTHEIEALAAWIGAQDDDLFRSLDKGLRSFGWPDYNVPLPHDDTWPGIALRLAARVRELEAALRETRPYVNGIAADFSQHGWRRETATAILVRVDATLSGGSPANEGTK